ncbi:MAG: hypothetical protein LBF32_04435 [Streptococcaceae bacterium]|jgi:ABC-type bacteriocin/lantibiotic exporter with double-glycine peptidase domain|nr:hypothetical protein [Streptococcaceae bacterium]
MRKINFIEQMEHSKCGLASAAMMINYFKEKVELSELRKKYGIPNGGYTIFQMKEVLEDYQIPSHAL